MKIYVTINDEGKITSRVIAKSLTEAYVNDQLPDTRVIVEVTFEDLICLLKWFREELN